MDRRVGYLAMLVIAALSVGSVSVSVVAQSAEPAVPAPIVSFTGRSSLVPCEEATPVFGTVDGVVQTRGMDCHGTITATDPRFEGTYLVASNADRYPTSVFRSSLTVETVVRRVENADGAWQGSATITADDMPASGEDGTIATETVVFTGEGAYAGLTAVVVFMPFVNATLRGVIFPGSPPPPPPAASLPR